MDQLWKPDDAHLEAHISTSNYPHSLTSHAQNQPGNSGALHQPAHHHIRSHHQTGNFLQSSDVHDGNLSHQPHHHGRPHLSTLPSTTPHLHAGPHDESYPLQLNGSYHYSRQHHYGGPHRPSETLSHRSSIGSHSRRDSQQGKPHHHAYNYGRSNQLEFPYPNRLSQYGESPSFYSVEGSHHSGRPRSHVGHHGGHQASHHGEHSHHREHHYHREHHHGEHSHHREHSYHRPQSISQLSGSFMSPSVLGVSPSHMGTKSSVYSMPQSHLAVRSHTSRGSSRIHPKESTKESDSWSDSGQIQKRKRAQRAHKKLHSGNIFQLIWEKISNLLWGLRKMMMSLTQSLGFETFIFIVVCLNTVILVAQTFTELEIRGEWYFMVLDSIFLSIYVIEAVLKLIALGVEYFYDPWNNLDFFIMVMAVLDFVLLQINALSYSFYNHSLFRILKVFKSMRALRAIRVLRRLSILTSLHEVTGTLSGSLPSITAILTLMFTCLFLFSVVLRALFRKSDPKRFQNIFTTLFTLFTMLTLDDWSLIYMDSRAQGAWYIIPILMIYIIIQYFIFLNLVIAVLVDNFQMALLKGLEKVKLEKAARVHEKLLDDSLTELNQADAEAQMSDGALQRQFIERMFSTMTEKQRELHFQYLQLVASVEQHQQKFRSQASVIDEIVDTAFEVNQEG
ncbi:cation channel sperm-associated protein 1 [Cricetulus griseus]|uniref:Cation channel sperm-associated protein 1 n=1 Tax=Cricetulus griseus TaxID=10029 RepID=A0A9J7FT80_CRIGR|nr:cation channel sperm-associated protein 1 [Cricetulus griseus]